VPTRSEAFCSCEARVAQPGDEAVAELKPHSDPPCVSPAEEAAVQPLMRHNSSSQQMHWISQPKRGKGSGAGGRRVLPRVRRTRR